MDMHPSTVLKLQTADMRSWQMAIWKFVANDKECVPWKPGCSAIVWFKRYTRSWRRPLHQRFSCRYVHCCCFRGRCSRHSLKSKHKPTEMNTSIFITTSHHALGSNIAKHCWKTGYESLCISQYWADESLLIDVPFWGIVYSLTSHYISNKTEASVVNWV